MTTALLPRGSRFGEIRLTGFLGSGGFSDVYAGVDLSGRKLAVKVFRNRTSDPDAQRRRIAAEREALSAVDSRGVAKLVADDLAAKDPWIASEFVDGLTIRESIEADGHLSREEALGVTRRLAEVLRDLHAAGIAHRDLTPSNIVFGQDGPVVIDFGSARMDLDYDSSGSILLAATPGFTPPEAVEGKSVGQKADVYALARIAQFMSGDEAEAFPTEIRQSLSPDPSDRPSAAAIADALSDFVQQGDRFKARQQRKLPRRFSLTTVAAVSLGFAALTAGVLYAGLIRQSPTPSLSEDERIVFSTDVTALSELFHLGGPYFGDVSVPQGLSAERVYLDHTTASGTIGDPFETTTLLDKIVFYSDGAETTRLELHANLASPNTLAMLLQVPKEEMIAVDDAVGLQVQFMADLALLEFDNLACPATMPDIVHYFEIRGIYFIGSTWECFSEHRVLFIAVQPGTTTLFRLSGTFADTQVADLAKLFASVIRTSDEALPGSIPLFALVSPEDAATDRISDVLAVLGFSSESLRTTRTSTPDLIEARIAIRLEPGQAFVPSNYFGGFDAWALLSERGELPAVTIGSFFTYDFNSSPIIENYFNERIIVVLELEWEYGFPPPLDLVPIPAVELPTSKYADQLFAEFENVARTPIEIWSTTDENAADSDYDKELWDDDMLLSKWMVEALGEATPEKRYNFATLGSVYLPVPADLSLNSTSFGDSNYAIRANPWNLNLTVFEPDVVREFSARVSEFILPGTNEAAMRTSEKGRWECKTVRRGEKAIGAVAARMTLTANCVDPAVAMFPDATDRITNEHPHVEIILYDPLTSLLEPGALSSELMRVDMSMSRVDDVAYVRFLIAALEEQLADLSVDEVRDALGRPAYGLGRFDSAGEPLAD